MGVRHLLHDQRPDLVLSGVNRGQNVAEDVTYSGTVAGAMEATHARHPGLRAVAGLRAASRARCIRGIAPSSMRPASSAPCCRKASPGTCWSTSTSRIASPARCRGRHGGAGPARANLFRIEERVDGRNNPLFLDRLRARQPSSRPTAPTSQRSRDRKISVTPLRIDLTDEPTLTRYAQLFDASGGVRAMLRGRQEHDGAEGRGPSRSCWRSGRKGLRDTGVLRAFETVPRSRFVPRRFVDLALRDVALPIACGQSTMAPSLMAEMIVALDAAARAPGAGGGDRLRLRHRHPGAAGGEVVSVERYRSLAIEAQARLEAQSVANARRARRRRARRLDAGAAVRPHPRPLRLREGADGAVRAQLTPTGRLVGWSAWRRAPPRAL